MLVATAIGGGAQALVGGQPLLILGVAEPTVLMYGFMYKFAEGAGFADVFVPWCAWVCIWAALFLFMFSVTGVLSFSVSPGPRIPLLHVRFRYFCRIPTELCTTPWPACRSMPVHFKIHEVLRRAVWHAHRHPVHAAGHQGHSPGPLLADSHSLLYFHANLPYTRPSCASP